MTPFYAAFRSAVNHCAVSLCTRAAGDVGDFESFIRATLPPEVNDVVDAARRARAESILTTRYSYAFLRAGPIAAVVRSSTGLFVPASSSSRPYACLDERYRSEFERVEPIIETLIANVDSLRRAYDEMLPVLAGPLDTPARVSAVSPDAAGVLVGFCNAFVGPGTCNQPRRASQPTHAPPEDAAERLQKAATALSRFLLLPPSPPLSNRFSLRCSMADTRGDTWPLPWER